MSVLVIAEHDNQTLKAATLPAVAAASEAAKAAGGEKRAEYAHRSLRIERIGPPLNAKLRRLGSVAARDSPPQAAPDGEAATEVANNTRRLQS